MAHDFKRLDVERAKIATSLQETRDLVAQWMGSVSDDSEDELPIKTQASATTGLGAAPAEKPVLNEALSKLQRTQAKKSVTPKVEAPKADSDSESESRTTLPAKKRRHVSALEAYKLSKKKR